jgi:hypothetical protein
MMNPAERSRMRRKLRLGRDPTARGSAGRHATPTISRIRPLLLRSALRRIRPGTRLKSSQGTKPSPCLEVNFEQGVIVPDHQIQRVRRSLLCRTYCATRAFSWLHADPYREFEGLHKARLGGEPSETWCSYIFRPRPVTPPGTGTNPEPVGWSGRARHHVGGDVADQGGELGAVPGAGRD